MKKNMFMVAALVGAFAMPAISQGAAHVWFELSDAGTSGVTQVSGGLDQTLILDKPADPGIYTFTLSMKANIDQGVLGHSTDLAADGPVAAGPFAGINPGVPDFFFTNAPGNLPPEAGTFADDIGSSVVGQYLGQVTLGTIEITIDKTNGPIGEINIFARVGGLGWGDSSADGAPDVYYGPNAALDGNPVAGTPYGDLAVVTIRQVPEPATMSLLGLGALALIRRRR